MNACYAAPTSGRRLARVGSQDTDGSGSLSRFEFVVGMLQKVGAVNEEDVTIFEKLFEQIDKDGSGSLT